MQIQHIQHHTLTTNKRRCVFVDSVIISSAFYIVVDIVAVIPNKLVVVDEVVVVGVSISEESLESLDESLSELSSGSLPVFVVSNGRAVGIGVGTFVGSTVGSTTAVVVGSIVGIVVGLEVRSSSNVEVEVISPAV